MKQDTSRRATRPFPGENVVRCGRRAFEHWVRRHRCLVVGASPEAEQPFHRLRYRRPTVLLLGEERLLLSEAQRGMCGATVSIPMVGDVDSLNLAVAGSLMLYEIFRRGKSSMAT